MQSAVSRSRRVSPAYTQDAEAPAHGRGGARGGCGSWSKICFAPSGSVAKSISHHSRIPGMMIPLQKPWNDDSPAKNQQTLWFQPWFLRWCRISSIHSINQHSWGVHRSQVGFYLGYALDISSAVSIHRIIVCAPTHEAVSFFALPLCEFSETRRICKCVHCTSKGPQVRLVLPFRQATKKGWGLVPCWKHSVCICWVNALLNIIHHKVFCNAGRALDLFFFLQKPTIAMYTRAHVYTQTTHEIKGAALKFTMHKVSMG